MSKVRPFLKDLDPLCKRNKPLVSCQNGPNVLLHAIELDEAATLALQMIEHARQALELRPASRFVWAMIDFLHVCWALQVFVQVRHGCEYALAKVALVAAAVPRVLRGPGLLMPFEEVIGDETVAVTLTQGAENALAVEAAGIGAGASF